MASLDIAIAGGGLMGRLTAWRLLLAGHRVSLFEAGSLEECPGAAATAAGMVSPLAELVDSEQRIFEMGMQSMQLWKQWLPELTGGPALFHEQGSIVVAHPQDQAELDYFSRQLELHRAPSDLYENLTSDALQQQEPTLSHFTQGLLLKPEAHIDNQTLLPLLLAEIIKLGGICKAHCPIRSISEQGLVSPEGTIKADWHIDCRGMGAKHLDSHQLRGVRGEVLWVQTDEITLQRPVRLLHPRYKLYIVPKPNQHFIIGATEIESEDLSTISLQSSLELSSALYSLNPAFAEARVVKSAVNLRPALMDNMPLIEQRPRYLYANGLYRHGYLLAPTMVAELLSHIDSDDGVETANTAKLQQA